MRLLKNSFSKPLPGFLDIIGLDLAFETIRRANDAFLSSPPILFSRAFLANPRAVGAACPSSSRLARTISAIRHDGSPWQGVAEDAGPEWFDCSVYLSDQ